MKVRLIAVFSLIVALVLLFAGGIQPTQAQPPSPVNEITLTAQDAGRQVDLDKNHLLTLNLEGNPSTGYGWQVQRVNAQVLRQVGDIEFKPGSGQIGAPGIQTIRFEGVAAGQTELTLVYGRPWEKDVPPLQTFSIQVQSLGAYQGVRPVTSWVDDAILGKPPKPTPHRRPGCLRLLTGATRAGAPRSATRASAEAAGPLARSARWNPPSRSPPAAQKICRSNTWFRATRTGGAAAADGTRTIITSGSTSRANLAPAPCTKQTFDTRPPMYRATRRIHTMKRSRTGSMSAAETACPPPARSSRPSTTTARCRRLCTLALISSVTGAVSFPAGKEARSTMPSSWLVGMIARDTGSCATRGARAGVKAATCASSTAPRT